jgi:hypothetical protein
VSGWVTPATPGPIVGWEVPSEPKGLGVRESIGAGWRVLRSHMGTLTATAALPEILRNLMIVPSILIVARGWDAMIEFFRGFDFRNYDPNDQLAMQQRLQHAFQPPADLAILSGVASGVSITLGLISLSLVTAATLGAIDGRRPSVAGSYRAVRARAGSLIVPAVILGIIWLLVSVPATLSQGLMMASDPAALRTQAAVAAVVGLLSLVVTVAAVVLAVRWSLVIPAILAEGLTFRRGLSRSAELTAGIRVRIFVILLVLGIMIAIVLGLAALILAIIVGVATVSLTGGVAGYLVATTIGGIISVPWVAGVLSHIYRLRAGPLVAASDAAPPSA